ncbi:OmcA/MtrC family decaheme c-type cytochrome [Ferrimonas balearica]|uniref:OmcA/MtrC family decaheme c-type cytochrome n=1 Tax=Ferrimonas balearica TaxID=44012 RepID=UPI001C9A10DB|nr:OmcA/MtrC family decaheme c-type cytochrome [Ferrimonas balearica]MBY5992997.1 OmcA/MtrC family decaheme c-type cytochrome [Ferrimonas balearica]
MTTLKLRLASLAVATAVALTGCSDGEDGAPGKDGAPGPIVTDTAKTLSVEIDTIDLGETPTLTFTVTNEAEIPVVGLDKFGFILSGLARGQAGDSHQWKLLGSDGCPASRYAQCGTLEGNGDGSYRYRFSTPLDADALTIEDDTTLRLVVRVGGETLGSQEVPYVNAIHDFRPDGNALAYTKDVVTDASCTQCHDDLSFHGGGKYTEVETCVSCHADNKVGPEALFTPLAHRVHIGVIAAPVGGCDNCHGDNPDAQDAANWKQMPTRQACTSCHSDVDFDTGENHVGGPREDNSACAVCHSESMIEMNHLATYQGQTGRREKVHLTVTDAKMVATPQAQPNIDAGLDTDQTGYVQLTVDIRDQDGQSMNLQLDKADFFYYSEFYINWGGQDMGMERGKILRVFTNKELYPGYVDTPVVLGFENGQTTFEIGPFELTDTFEGDLSDSYGMVTPRIWFCMDAQGENLESCKETSSVWGQGAAGFNWLHFFDDSGLLPERPRRQVVTNEKCGSCHGLTERDSDGMAQMTLNCRSCHPVTKTDPAFFGTTCASGAVDHNGDGQLDEQVMLKSLAPRGQRDWTTASNAAEECLACHNANNPPTQVIRDAHTKQGDADYVEQLTMSHPDHKVWIHAMHANNRANQGGEGWVRNVEYSADLANCIKCHEGDSFDARYLVGRKPLALDLDYMDTYDGLDPDNGKDTSGNKRYAIDAKADAYVSPTAAVCLSCHGKRAPEAGEDRRQVRREVVSHMTQHGAQFGVPLGEYRNEESCAVCHDLDNLKAVHQLD